MTSGRAGYITPQINGKLEGFFISSNTSIGVEITLENKDIVIFEIINFVGEQFIPVRLGVVSFLGESFRDGYTKWALNDKLKVEIKGPVNSEVNCVVRYC